MIVSHENRDVVLQRLNNGADPEILESYAGGIIEILLFSSGQKRFVKEYDIRGYVFYEIWDYVE